MSDQDQHTTIEEQTAPAGRSLWRRLIASAQGGLLLLLVLCAVWVGGGHLLLPLLTTQKDAVEARFSQLLGTSVAIGGLEGSWSRLSPGFALQGLTLQLDPAEPATRFGIDSGELSVDVWRSLRLRRLALSHLALSGLELSLQQSANGRWSLRGLPPGDRDYKDLILDLLLTTPDIRLEETTIRIAFADGHEISLRSVYLQLENDGERHDLSLQFRPDSDRGPQLAVLRLSGDPRRAFTADAWLSLEQLDLLPQLARYLPADWQLDELAVAGELWVRFDPAGIQSAALRLDDLRLDGQLGAAGRVAIADTAASIGAWPEPAAAGVEPAWRLTVQNLVSDVNQVFVAPGRLNLRLPLDPALPWNLQAERLDLSTLAALALSLPLPEAAREALVTLAPAGRLKSLLLESDRLGEYPEGFLLQSEFDALAVQAWRAAPSATGLSGYMALTAAGGFAELDSRQASLQLPNLFRSPWHYDRLTTRVEWELGAGSVRVSSSPIRVSSADLAGQVQFSLHNSGIGTDDFRSDLALAVGMDWMNVAIHADYLPALERTADTMQWLDTALQGGRIVDSGFLLRSSSGRRDELDALTHSSWYRVEDGVLQFLPEWPAVQVHRAAVLVSDQHTDVVATAATIAGIEASRVAARVRPAGAGGSLLDLQVTALADAGRGLDFLRQTPVREQVGSALDDWQGSGELLLQVGLQQPLGNNPAAQQLQVSAQTRNAVLDIRPYQLVFAGLDGEIGYSHDAGLQAGQLQAQLFGRPVTLAIETQSEGEARLFRITGQGDVDVEQLEAWEGQSDFVRRLLGFTTGSIDYLAEVDVPVGAAASGVPQLRLRSELQGLAVNLPVPFAKTADATRRLQLDLAFQPTGQDLRLRYQDWLSGQLILDNTAQPRGQLYFGERNRDFTIRQSSTAEPGLLVNGELAFFDFDAWREVATRFAGQEGDTELAGVGGLQDYLRLVDVQVGELRVAGQELTDIDVEVLFQDEVWRIHGNNALLAGDLLVPLAASLPWTLQLDYLRFPPRPEPDPEADEDDVEIDLLEAVDPRELPAFSFATDELSIGPSNLGSWRFDLQPDGSGARISNLHMQETSSRIHGSTPEEGGEVLWYFRDGSHDSSFNGTFAAGDLAQVMPKWGHDANIVSRNANFSSTLRWPGSPLAFSLKKASGDIQLAINNGRFVDIDSGSSRLLGAFNFDSLVRRLELDFSDLYQRGFAFDSIRGQLGFTDGVVRFTRPLVIDGPSSRISIEGEINLPRETIAADMQVRIPLGENISMLAGLLGAWPIALSTYLASKIFADQVEDFTTILYRLDGPWSNPQAGFAPPEEAAVQTPP